ncbi:MAG: TPM domain-containing protein [Verrucomicrobiae bacterium]|nr:TPM domain-containing protein [Verrucomicrobiae bacterium]
MKTRDFIKQIDLEKIKQAIAEAEKKSSGEIRVLVTTKKVEDPLAEAEKEFANLKMHETRDRNGVLILFAPESRKFAVWGDFAVHEKCGTDFWQGIVDHMTPLLKEEKFTEAIVTAVKKIGLILVEHFPKKPDDTNELSDEVIVR